MVRDDVVFAVDGEEYRWRDVLLAAARWGDWEALERRAREGWAIAAHAADTGAAFPAEDVETAAREFRYERDLLTAKSMEDWLERWQLSLAEWTAYLSREIHRGSHPGAANGLVERYRIPEEDAPGVMIAEAVCSNAVQRWTRKLAERASVRGLKGTDASSATIASHAASNVSAGAVGAMLGFNPEDIRDSAGRLERIEAAFAGFRASQLTERALQEFVASRQMDWMRFECRTMAFPDEMMAAEAALLLTEDNEGFTGVYSAAHAEPRAAQFFLDEIDAVVRDKFVGSRAGDLVGPVRVNAEFVLYLVIAKTLPSISDPAVRRRAEQGVLKSLLERHVASRVKWRGAMP